MKKPLSLKRLLLILCLGGALALPAAGSARADVMIMPIRIVFQSRDRMQDITVINNSRTSSGIYELGWLYTTQTEEGAYKRIEAPLNPELNPETAILFSPRRVTLPPGGKQRVRLSLRRPAELPDGEYRAHLHLKSVTASRGMEMKGGDGSSVGMGMQVGLAVPVIIRQGPYDGDATIGAPRFAPGSADGKTPPRIQFAIERSGKYSAIGNIRVFWQPPDGGEEILIARRNAVNIFAESPRRLMDIPLKEKRVVGGTVRIIFEGDGPDKGILFDEKTFPVGG